MFVPYERIYNFYYILFTVGLHGASGIQYQWSAGTECPVRAGLLVSSDSCKLKLMCNTQGRHYPLQEVRGQRNTSWFGSQ